MTKDLIFCSDNELFEILRLRCAALRMTGSGFVYSLRGRPKGRPLKLSTKCQQLETPKWELPKKFPFWHGLNVKGGIPSPSPLHNPPMRVQALPHRRRFVYSLIFLIFPLFLIFSGENSRNRKNRAPFFPIIPFSHFCGTFFVSLRLSTISANQT